MANEEGQQMTSRPADRVSHRTWISAVGAWARRSAPALVGLLAGLIAVAGAWVPSYWGDEAASVLSAERSLPSLFSLLSRIDAVHGVYYLFLHGWIAVAGTSEAVVRFPSAVAIGFAAAGTVVVGRRLAGPTTGILAGCVLAVLPVVTRLGMEARSYAFTMAAAVWLTVWCIALVRRRESRWWAWAAFAVAFAASLYLFVYLALMAVVQVAVLVVHRAPRATMLRWLAASSAAAVLALPIVVAGRSQRGQLAFLARRDYATAESVVVGQWFGSSWWFAAAVWMLIAVAVATALLVPRMRSARQVVVVAAVWLTVPTAAILMGNAVLGPMYNMRYLSFSAPAVALLAAVGLRGLAALASLRVSRPDLGRVVPLIGLALVVVAAVPGYVAQRGPFAKDHGADFRQVAEAVSANATAGDAIVFDQATKPSRRPRLSLDLYPEQFAGLDDVGLKRPLASRAWLWDAVAPLPAVTGRLQSHTRVWAVESGGDMADVAELRSIGYSVERVIPVHRTIIYELVKEGT
jgi:mannosyltransferase